MSFRKKSLNLYKVLLISLAALAGILSLTTNQAPAYAEPSGDQRFGIVHAEDSNTYAYDSGASWEVVLIRWNQLQPSSSGQWDPNNGLNEHLLTAQQAGREVVGVLVGTPAWATDGTPGIGVPSGLYQPITDAENVWASFVRQAVEYYGPRGINRWVVWRDPDIPATLPGNQWEGDIEDYYQLLKSAYITIKQINPNTQVHIAGTGKFDPTWFASFTDIVVNDLTAETNNYYFDVSTVHTFGSPENVFTQVGNHFVVMEQRGIPLKEVWVNETNARPALDPETYEETIDFREYPNITLEQQAAFIIQGYALGFAANRGARIATYRLVDDLNEDNGEAYGLVRSDGSPRPAFSAYQTMVDQFSGFVFARRVDEETFPLIDYVRLTHPGKVTHIVWARTEDNATLIIPARSEEATLLDMAGNQWTVQPSGDVYRVAVPGADCNDPEYNCLIGGNPWILVEEGLEDPLNETPPSVSVEEGGTPPTPDPGMSLTATARVMPSATPTPQPSATPTSTIPVLPTRTPVANDANTTSTPEPQETVPTQTSEATAIDNTPTQTPMRISENESANPTLQTAPDRAPNPGPITLNPDDVRPRGLTAALPYILAILGMVVMGAGGWFFFTGYPSTGISFNNDETEEELPAKTEQIESIGQQIDQSDDALSEDET